MRKIQKIFLSILIIFVLVNIFSQVFATITTDDYEPSKITDSDTKVVFTKTGVILGTIRNISAVVSVITLMIIGVKYMLGSVEEKANYKQTMLPYVIGCVLAVSGTSVVSFIYNALNG